MNTLEKFFNENSLGDSTSTNKKPRGGGGSRRNHQGGSSKPAGGKVLGQEEFEKTLQAHEAEMKDLREQIRKLSESKTKVSKEKVAKTTLYEDLKRYVKSDKAKKHGKYGLVAIGTAGAIYGGKKLYDSHKKRKNMEESRGRMLRGLPNQ